MTRLPFSRPVIIRHCAIAHLPGSREGRGEEVMVTPLGSFSFAADIHCHPGGGNGVTPDGFTVSSAVTDCNAGNVTALVACSNLVQGLDYLCVPVTTQEIFCQ